MEYIEITTQALEKDINSMTESLKSVIEQMKVMVEDMKELNHMWTGAASSAYSVQFMQDCERMNEVQEMMFGYLTRLEEAESEYNRCENMVSDIIRTIRI